MDKIDRKIINLLQMDKFNHRVNVETGIRQDECKNLMKEFFSNLRKRKSEDKCD